MIAYAGFKGEVRPPKTRREKNTSLYLLYNIKDISQSLELAISIQILLYNHKRSIDNYESKIEIEIEKDLLTTELVVINITSEPGVTYILV